MESNHTVQTSDLLVKLARLEDQVTTLSSQLEVNKLTINQMQEQLSVRDRQICELESKLILAQNSLQKSTFDKIIQCREQVKHGIDTKLVTPVLTQIQHYIESTQTLIAEAKDFIVKKKVQLNASLDATSDRMRQSPDQARLYLEKTVVEPLHDIIGRAVRSSSAHYQACRNWLERDIVNQCAILLNQIAFTAHELPLNARLILQTRCIDPAKAYLDSLPNLLKNMKDQSANGLQQWLVTIKIGIQKCLDWIVEQIKKSSFWDGKHRIQTAA